MFTNGCLKLVRRVTGLRLFTVAENTMRAPMVLLQLAVSMSVGLSTNPLQITQEPIVTVKEGKLRGSVKKNVDGSNYYSFKGVPYAKPPVGELRFQAPLQLEPWEGIRDALEHGSVCPQYDLAISQLIEGDENCLYLNVYSKTLQPSARTPVMVYIHGGAYMAGSGDTDTHGPEFLLQHDVIVVTINYRLEVLGFLCLDTPEVPGNAGMKDQVFAMRWVKANIANFGGDPDNITLFGESAGASSVTYHMLSPMSKGLFNKVIAQSGTAIHDWSIGLDGKERAFRAGKALGKDTNNDKELLELLRSVPAVNLTKLTLKTRTADEKRRGLPMHFVPVVEKKFDNVEAFMTEDPLSVLLKKKVNVVPLIIGYNSAEGMLMLEDQLKKAELYNAEPDYLLPREIVLKVNKDKLKEFGKRLLKYYVGDKSLSNDTAKSIVDMQTDVHFLYNIQRFAYLYSKLNAPVYMYRFDYETELNVIKNALGLSEMKGASHADDLFYLFYNPLNNDTYEGNDRLKKIVFNLTKLWADFAKTGNPTPDNSSDVKWLPYTATNKEYLILNESFSNGLYADKERVEFWNKLYCESSLPYIHDKSHL